MGESGKDLLREHIKNKRANEGLEEIPHDLFAKKPKHELSVEERRRLMERREKNKEAAEKSRRKKREEFEMLQNENDQLEQDKRELAAMVEHLKHEVKHINKCNDTLRVNIDQLKRWIASRAKELGLDKHVHTKETKTAEQCDISDKGAVHTSRQTFADRLQSPRPSAALTHSCEAPVSSPRSASPAPQAVKLPPLIQNQQNSHAFVEEIQPTETHVSVSPKIPMQRIIDPANHAKDQHVMSGEKEVIAVPIMGQTPNIQHVVGRPEVQSLQMPHGQQVVVLPKDAVIVVQGEDGQQFMTVASELQQTPTSSPQLQIPMAAPISSAVVQEQEVTTAVSQMQPVFTGVPVAQTIHTNTGSTTEVVYSDVNEEECVTKTVTGNAMGKVNGCTEITSAASAIETLLKMGYRIHLEGQPIPEKNTDAVTTITSTGVSRQ